MLKRLFFPFPVFLLLYSFCCYAGHAHAVETEKIAVLAEGMGETRTAALKDAWTNAVRQAVGMYLASASSVKSNGLDDKLTEEIAAYSRGQMDSFKVLSENEANGIWTVRIRAVVDKEILKNTFAASTRKTVRLDGANLAAQMQTAADRKGDAADVLDVSKLLDFSKCLEYEPSAITFKIAGTPVVFMQHVLKMNLEKYRSQVAELEKLVSQMSLKKCQMPLTQPLAKNAFAILRMKDFKLPAAFLKDAAKQEFLDNSWLTLTYPLGVHASAYPPELQGVQENLNSFTVRLSNVNPKNPLENPAAFQIDQGADRGTEEWHNMETPWCFVQKVNSASCYEPGPDLINVNLENIYKLSFSISTPQFPELGGSGKSFTLVLPPVLNGITSLYKINYFIAPALFIGTDDGSKIWSNDNSSSYFTPVFVFYQRIDLSPDEIASLKEIGGEYHLEQIYREMYPHH